MDILIFVFIFLLGTIIGSFLNVVIYRFNTGKSIVHGHSICMTCNKSLRWYELIPVFSFLIQSGKCRRCASAISHQYPIVEFGTGFIFALIAYHFLPILAISYWSFIFLLILFAFIFSLLIVISVYDIRHKIIPDKLVYLYALVSFFSVFLSYESGFVSLQWPSLINILSGPIFALPFAFIWIISKGKWMGLGDAKLILGIGWMLGPLVALSAVIISFWMGAIWGLFYIFLSKNISDSKMMKIGMKTEIPFAPFLILGTLISFFFNLDIFSLVILLEI
jgi:leader peptidase (prepilin peptidase) / N-methyltransferase